MVAVLVNSDVLVPTVVTLVVAVLQSTVEELGGWVVVVAVEYKTDAGSCDAVVKVMGRVLCVVTSIDVSILGTDVVLLVTSG